jgi:hypothetical protein
MKIFISLAAAFSILFTAIGPLGAVTVIVGVQDPSLPETAP